MTSGVSIIKRKGERLGSECSYKDGSRLRSKINNIPTTSLRRLYGESGFPFTIALFCLKLFTFDRAPIELKVIQTDIPVFYLNCCVNTRTPPKTDSK